MSIRNRLAGLAAAAILGAVVLPPSASAARPDPGIKNVVPITEVLAFGQKVTAVAVEYSSEVNPRTLDLVSYTVSDSLYNFRFNPVADLTDPTKRADRTITAVYTNDTAAMEADEQSDPGSFVIIELASTDPGGNTVMAWRGGVRVIPDLQTQVVQNEVVYEQPGNNGLGRGPILAEASDVGHGPTKPSINVLADDFVYDRFTTSPGTVVPYAYYLPEGYDPTKKYATVVILPGQGQGFITDPTTGETNEGVHVASDIPATAWSQEKWTGTDEDVIVLAVQNPRIGSSTVQANAMVEVLNAFSAEFAGVDQDRLYVSTVSYGSTLAWVALANYSGLFDGALITGGFANSTAQATAIAASSTPVYITHGTHDHLLNVVNTGQRSFNQIWNAYIALGKTPAQANALVKYTEYPDSAFYEPDRHLAAAPTYEDETILQWLLAQ